MTTAKKRWTWAQLWEYLGDLLDISDENFVSEDLCRSFVNNAIDACEDLIHGEHPNYFLTYQAPTAFEADIDALDLPTNLYGTSIIKIILNDGTSTYECKELTALDKFLQYREDRVLDLSGNNHDFYYFLANESESGPRALITPVPSDDTWSYEFWYQRQANRLEDDEDICDLPDFMDYVFAHVTEQVDFKRRRGSVAHQASKMALAEAMTACIEKAQNLRKDAETEVKADGSFYEGHN